MERIVGIVYLVFMFAESLAALFIVYHLRKYTISTVVANLTTVIFLTVFAILLIANVSLFANIPWDEVLASQFLQ